MRKSDNGKGHRIREASIKRRRKKQSKKGKGTYVHNPHMQSKKAVALAAASPDDHLPGHPAKQAVDG